MTEFNIYLICYSKKTEENEYFLITTENKELYDFFMENKNIYLNKYIHLPKNKKYHDLYTNECTYLRITKNQFEKINNPNVIYNSD